MTDGTVYDRRRDRVHAKVNDTERNIESETVLRNQRQQTRNTRITAGEQVARADEDNHSDRIDQSGYTYGKDPGDIFLPEANRRFHEASLCTAYIFQCSPRHSECNKKNDAFLPHSS